jgi:hypothetical protein
VRGNRFSPRRGEDLRAALHSAGRGNKASPRKKKKPEELKKAANQEMSGGLPSVSKKYRNIQEREETPNARRTFRAC